MSSVAWVCLRVSVVSEPRSLVSPAFVGMLQQIVSIGFAAVNSAGSRHDECF